MPRRQVVLTAQAGRDFDDIIEWTAERFGRRQAEAYERLILATLQRLEDGSSPMALQRVAGEHGIQRMPVGDGRDRGRHFLYIHDIAVSGRQLTQVLRILHTAMDPTLHLPPGDLT